MPGSLLFSTETDASLTSLSGAPRWTVALSGGLDSTVLLHQLSRWCQQHSSSPALRAIHIHHNLQSQATGWADHCAHFCESLEVPFSCHRVTVTERGQGLEAAARDARYEVFETELTAGEVLFTGHHLDDQVETFFLRLMRGAGLEGLSAMPGQRALGLGLLQRPLLDVPRDTLEAYADQHKLRYVEDPSNQDVSLDRNYLRQQLLPLLAARWPGYRGSVQRSVSHLSVAAGQLSDQLPPLQRIISCMGDEGLSLPQVMDSEPALAALLLRAWLAELGLAMPDSALLNEFVRQLSASAKDGNPRMDTGQYVLQRYRDGIYRVPQEWQGSPPPGFVSPGLSCQLRDVGAISLVAVAGQGLHLDGSDRLEISFRQGGESCRPVGQGSRSIKKVLQEAAVPPWWRERVPLLSLDGELLAIGDICLCQSSRLKAGPGLWKVAWIRN